MSVSDVVFAFVLALAACSVTYGVALIFPPAGWIVGGVLAAGWAALLLIDVRAPSR